LVPAARPTLVCGWPCSRKLAAIRDEGFYGVFAPLRDRGELRYRAATRVDDISKVPPAFAAARAGRSLPMSGKSYEPCQAESGFCSNTIATPATNPGQSYACIISQKRQNVPKSTKPGLIDGADIVTTNLRLSWDQNGASFQLLRPLNKLGEICGVGHSPHACRCTPTQIQRYRARVSGPLLDRIDIHLEAPAVSVSELRSGKPGEPSAAIRERIESARSIQRLRFSDTQVTPNARMTQKQVRQVCNISRELGDLLERAMNQLSLSARAYDRILKVSRTIADLAGAEHIAAPHLLEAIQYRSLDRTTSI